MKRGMTLLTKIFEVDQVFIEDKPFASDGNEQAVQKLNELKGLVSEYNSKIMQDNRLTAIPVNVSFMELPPTYNLGFIRVADLLNQVTQVQMFILQNEKELLVLK